MCKIDNVAHKARVGGVALHLTDAGSVRSAAERMGGNVVVAEQVSQGVEVLIGAVRDLTTAPPWPSASAAAEQLTSSPPPWRS